MSTQIIPAKTILTCDMCKEVIRQSKMKGKLTLKRDGLDWQGCAVGDCSTHLDLCDSCVMVMENVINELLKKAKS